MSSSVCPPRPPVAVLRRAPPRVAPPAAAAGRDDALAALVAASPPARRARQPPQDAGRVGRLGRALEAAVRAADPGAADRDVETRVYRYYLPVYFWMAGLLEEHQAAAAAGAARPLVLGFSCPQGGGKSTMVRFMRLLFKLDGKRCAGASLDDFYLTYKEQTALAEEHDGNALLRYRGNPGTHDMDLLTRTLDDLALLNTPAAPPSVTVPSYDKTCYNGRGDRAPPSAAEHLTDGLDIFLLEGWCMGFRAKGQAFAFEDDAVSPSGDLRTVDSFLEGFDAVYARLDGMLVIEVDRLECVYEWRAQPEREARAAGKPGLTEDEVKDFVSRFIPSYELYTPRLYDPEESLYPQGKELHIKINLERQPL